MTSSLIAIGPTAVGPMKSNGVLRIKAHALAKVTQAPHDLCYAAIATHPQDVRRATRLLYRLHPTAGTRWLAHQFLHRQKELPQAQEIQCQ